MDLGFMHLGPCGHKRKPMHRMHKMMTVLVANCVQTVKVTYLSVVAHW